MSLAALLMGVANRAGEVKRRDEQRNYQWEMVGKQAQSEDLLKQIEDPSLPDTERQGLVDRFEDLHKLPKGSGHFAVSMHKPLQRLVQQQAPQLAPSVEQQQMPSAPAAPAPAATEPVAGGGGKLGNVPAMPTNEQQPLQALPRATPTLGMPPSPPPEMAPPNTELGRRQQQGHELMKQNMSFIHSLGLSPEDEKLAVQHLLNIPPAVQSAIIGGQYKVAAAQQRGLTTGNSGSFVTYQVPGEDNPRRVFEVTKGSHAGMTFDPNTFLPAQLPEGSSKLQVHPDKLITTTDKDGNMTLVNATKKIGTETSVDLGPVGKPNSPAGSGTYRPMYDTAGNQIGWANSKDPSDWKPMTGAPAGASATKPSEATQTKFDQLSTMTDQLNQLHEFVKMPSVQNAIGPFAGWWTEFTRGGPIGAPDEVQEAFRIVQDMSDMLLRARSGAQINEQEYARLRKLMPNPTNNLDKFRSDLKGFTREINVALKRRGMPTVTGGEAGNIPTPPGSLREVGETKKFSNGKTGRWDGKGWVEVQ